MESFNPIPKAISHKELGSLLKNAAKGNENLEILNDESSLESQEFNELLANWGKQSEKLLNILKTKEPYISEGKDANSLMALGAMESHLNIAFQAFKASTNN